MSALSILPQKADSIDFLSLGALVTRLDPGIVPFGFADTYDIHVSGGEYNVAANLSRCFGLSTAVASAMVAYPIGAKVEGEVRKMGVRGIYKRFKHDGVRGPNIAQVWSDRGQGVRAPVVFYNRANEAAALLSPGDFDWAELFARGVRWFHSGGIFSALSATTPELVIEAMKAARKAGAVVSFDLNYRAKLWSANGAKALAPEILGRIGDEVDVLVGNEEDLQLGLGLKGPEIHGTSKLDPQAFYAAIEEVKTRWPRIKAVATTLREVKSTNRHLWSAVLWLNGERYAAPTAELDVYDRDGGGDGFAAGLVYGQLEGLPPQEAVSLGWAHGALLTTFPGDTTMATLDQVKAFAKGGSARIQR